MIVYIIVGFVAQIIDGALGMAYGVTSTTFLLSLGIPPVAASASVHTAEIFASGASGLAHLRFGNVDKKLFKKLLIPGIMGGILGAYILTVVPGKTIKPFIAFYLLIMGLIILRKAFKKIEEKEVKTKLLPLGVSGGFFDAVGGGGWGPIVTSTLVARGHNPRFSIGSVNLAEFFVTIAEVATFLTIIGLVHWQIIVGLIIGGVLAAPLAAYVCRRLPPRALMIMVGLLIVALSIRTICSVLL
ncbi:MAG: sulfite exporter TauE/SafE family protein [Elusimicrobiota bacterium]|nr:sulfite exporter TauE/SafE family protein [Elusimicrobiota bacterium]